MIENRLIINYLTLTLIIYYLTQLSMDGYTRRKRTSEDQVINHGIRETDTDVFTPGISSLSMFIIWFAIIMSRRLFLGTDSLQYFRINYPDYINDILRMTGMLLVFLGVSVAIWSRIIRGINSPNWGFTKSSKLLTNGPYRYIRHPSYTFYILVTIGLAILTQILGVYLLILGVSRYSNIVKVEEEMLIRQFGNEYVQYQRRTKKFIPFVW